LDGNDITVTLTEFEHEVIIDALQHIREVYSFVFPSYEEFNQLENKSETFARYDCIENLTDRLQTLHFERFNTEALQ
jgi:hypothetical protein